MRRTLGLLLLLGALLAGCGGNDAKLPAAPATIRIGTKNFTEQRILGEIYRQALEQAGFRVALKTDIGSTEIIHEALRGGALDMYPEYIGVLLSEVAGVRDRPGSPARALELAREYEGLKGFEILDASPFSDSNALAVLPTRAATAHMRSIGDLAQIRKATIAAPPEFRTRVEGLVGLQEEYGLRGLRIHALPIGAQYAALDGGHVDAAAVFTTDGQLAQRHYRLLADPKGLFADQHVAPIISSKVTRRYGSRLATTINAVTRRLTVGAMRRMNADVDLHGQTPAAVAKAFLAGG